VRGNALRLLDGETSIPGPTDPYVGLWGFLCEGLASTFSAGGVLPDGDADGGLGEADLAPARQGESLGTSSSSGDRQWGQPAASFSWCRSKARRLVKW
jgi:hypothetical protein